MAEAESQVKLFKPVDVDKLKVEGNSIREFAQVLKIQFVKDGSEVQVVFDRQHKKNMKLSKPVGYIRFTGQECVKLAGMFLASASVLAAKNTATMEARLKVAKTAVDFFSAQVKESAEQLTKYITRKVFAETPET